jgi:hypothetical protein
VGSPWTPKGIAARGATATARSTKTDGLAIATDPAHDLAFSLGTSLRPGEVTGLDPPTSGGTALSPERALSLLEKGELSVEGQVPWSSNITLLCRLQDEAGEMRAVYKPRRGERPLWDFPHGSLYLRELAAWQVSQYLGWDLVPPTTLRDGPYGPGMLQAFIPHDPEMHYLELDAPEPMTVARIAAFDLVINNADRKSGHVLLDEAGQLWAIDHGIAFHVEPKLRTVVWELAGESLPDAIAKDLRRFAGALEDPESALREALLPLLDSEEVDALHQRTLDLLAAGAYPDPDPDRRMIPWPPV